MEISLSGVISITLMILKECSVICIFCQLNQSTNSGECYFRGIS